MLAGAVVSGVSAFFMIFVKHGAPRWRTIKARSKSFVSSSPLNALAQHFLVLGLFFSVLTGGSAHRRGAAR
jgi:hypothetical protein